MWTLPSEHPSEHPCRRVQGGPVGQYDYSFQQEQHLFAAAGYVVLSVNPRGSSGRGQAFCQALFADWGGPALKDVLTAVDYAVGQGWSDPDRLCVGGWSCKRRRPNNRCVLSVSQTKVLRRWQTAVCSQTILS